jgi:hypothetical protein
MKTVSAVFFALLSLVLILLKPVQGLAEVVDSKLPANVLQRARDLQLWDRDEWRRLGHYQKSFFGGWTSEATGLNFYVASHGRTEPQSELEATLAGFFSTEKRVLEGKNQPSQSVRCQFPARYDFLNREMGLDSLVPQQDCPEWKEFRDRVAAKSITLVFSSFYAGNPSSTYGHSLLRLNKSDASNPSEHHQLLDYGVNYAAEQTTSNAVMYTLYGLSGMFHGSFTNIPYYYKVREYGDFESRDLWEYDLILTPNEVARVVEHLWELGSTYFDYYYLTQNCSFHMLTLIEAAAPRTHLVSRVPWWVIPTDTVKAFFDDGLVARTNFRASLYSQFRARLARLSASEESELKALVTNDRKTVHPSVLLPPTSLAPESRSRIADAYMDYVDLHYAREIYKKEEAFSAPKDALLIARSKLPMTPPLDFSTPPVASPNESHGSARTTILRAQNQNYGGATDFEIRFALHDLADPTRGLPPNADIDFFHLELRYWDRPQALRIEHAVLFGIGTYPPLDSYVRKFSWRAKLNLDRVDDPRCGNCLAGGAWGGGGFSFSLSQPILAYALVDGEFLTSPDFLESKFSVRAGPTLGLRVRFSDALAWLTEAHYAWAVAKPQFDDYQIDSHLRLVPTGTPWGIDLHGLWRTENREVAVGVLRYF